MKVEITTRNDRLLKEMLQRNRRYGDRDAIVNEAIESFYQVEKKRSFR